eukprot:m.102981 g.102981  ORF g.102981 m.102981 type:complete len:672 (-) comp13791_c0_seq1:1130-3145(-)
MSANDIVIPLIELRVGVIELLWLVAGSILGAGIVIITEIVILRLWWFTLVRPVNPLEKEEYKQTELPPDLKQYNQDHPRPLAYQRDQLPASSGHVFNFVCHFLFRELRDTLHVKRHFMRSLNKDFQLLKENTSIGKILERVRVDDVFFGTSLPLIVDAVMKRPKSGDIGEGDHGMDVGLQVKYNGGFKIKIVADLTFGKKAIVTVAVKEMTGKMQFSLRHFPHSHWFVSFDGEPKIEFEVSSVFEGVTVPQLSLLITNQIRRTIRKKHTLPQASLRYWPFFKRPDSQPDLHVNIQGRPIQEGTIYIRIIRALGFKGFRPGSSVFCQLSLSAQTLWDAEEEENRPKFRLLQLEISKKESKQLSASLSKSEATVEILQEGLSGSVEVGDTLVEINGVAITSLKQAQKLLQKIIKPTSVTLKREADDTESLDIESDGIRTEAVAVSEEPQWNQPLQLEATRKHKYLIIRIFDQKSRSGPWTGKALLVGCLEIPLQQTALFCISNRTALRDSYPIRASLAEAAPITGRLEIQISHKPSDAKPRTSMKEPPAVAERMEKPRPKAVSKSPTSSPKKKKQVQHTKLDEDAMDVGSELFKDLPLEQRRIELNQLMTNVQTQIDLESETRSDLERQLDEADSVQAQDRLRENIEFSDERMSQLADRILRVLSAIQTLPEP